MVSIGGRILKRTGPLLGFVIGGTVTFPFEVVVTLKSIRSVKTANTFLRFFI